jgi:hypothetical protein
VAIFSSAVSSPLALIACRNATSKSGSTFSKLLRGPFEFISHQIYIESMNTKQQRIYLDNLLFLSIDGISFDLPAI